MKKTISWILICCLCFGGLNTFSIPAKAQSVEEDLYEKTYQIQSASNRSCLYCADGNITASDSGSYTQIQIIRYGENPMGEYEGQYPIALLSDTEEYFGLSVNARAGAEVTLDSVLQTDLSQQFLAVRSENYKSSNPAYKLYHPQSGMYLGINESGKLSAYGKTAPEYDFLLNETGVTLAGSVMELSGFDLLTEAQQSRYEDIVCGTAPRCLYLWGGTNYNGFSYYDSILETLQSLEEKSAEEQKDALVSILTDRIYRDQTNWYSLPELPNIDKTETTLSEGVYGEYQLWVYDGNQAGYFYTYTIKDSYGTQTIYVYVQDDTLAAENANRMLEAIRSIPYPVRKNVRNLYVRNDEANNYNCGQSDLYMRLNYSPDVDNIAQYITHEFGHSLDFTNNVNDSGDWSEVMEQDMLTVSTYGTNSGYEDFAEFGRLYFQMYGNPNAMYALRQIYPARYAYYTKILLQSGYEDIYENFLFSAFKKTSSDGVIARLTFDDFETGFSSGMATTRSYGNPQLSDDAVSGKSLYLDGSSWLKLMDSYSTSLLTGYDEITISYYSKSESKNSGWTVFAAPNSSDQVYEYEQYLGVCDNSDNLFIERYYNEGQRSESIYADSQNDWKHVVIVITADASALYLDGEEIASLPGDFTLSKLLGKNSVFQIGKGNWYGGEYYQGWLDEFTVYGSALSAEQIEAIENDNLLAYFSFDDQTEGFSAIGAKAYGNAAQLTEGVKENALYLDGTAYLNVAKTDGSSLLGGCNELTISYYSKSESDNAGWTFFAAPDASGQEYLYENYIGVLDNKSGITAERYLNSGSRPNTVTGEYEQEKTDWKHVVLILDQSKTSVYVDGVLIGSLRSAYSVSDILKDDSILQIGKGNWGSGEYYKGSIDELYIWNEALSAVEVSELEEQVLVELGRAKAVMEKIDALGTVTTESREQLLLCQSAYDALSAQEKRMVTNYDVLVNAEEAYQQLTAVTPTPTQQPDTGEDTKKGGTLLEDDSNPPQNNTNSVKKGAAYTVGNYTYKIISVGKTKKAAVTGTTKKYLKTIKIPAKVTISGISFKVTQIGKGAFKNCRKAKKIIIGKNVTAIKKNAFSGCTKCTQITIKSKKLKSIGKNAFRRLKKAAVIKVPAAKYKKYKRLLKNSPQKIRKIA